MEEQSSDGLKENGRTALHAPKLGKVRFMSRRKSEIKPTRYKVMRELLNITIVVVSYFLIYYNDNYSFVLFNTYTVTLKDLPLIILTGLCGPLAGMLDVFVTVFFKSISDFNYAYTLFMYLLLALVVNYILSRDWIKSWKKILLGVVIMGLVMESGWAIVVATANGTISTTFDIATIGLFLLGSLPECFIGLILLRLIYVKSPNKIKRLFWESKRYVTPGDYYYEKKEPSKFSRRITKHITIFLALLCILAAVFANFLLPTIPDKPTSQSTGTGTTGTTGSSSSSDSSNSSTTSSGVTAITDTGTGSAVSFNLTDTTSDNAGIQSVELNASSIAFDIKLILMLASIAIPIGCIGNFIAQKYWVAPITRMSSVMKKFAELDEEKIYWQAREIHALNIQSGDEIETLYHDIEKTIDATVDYLQAVKQEKKLEADLKIAKATSEAKSAFLSNMSHEIRTPINAVLGMDEMILREYEDPKLIQYAMNIQTSGRTLLSLINDILDFSKIEAGKMEIIPVEYDFSSDINDLVNMISPRAEQKGLDMIINVDHELPHILYGDDIRIKQCILNILTNAVKYTEKGSVTMNIGYEKIDKDNIYLNAEVADTGIGIKEEDIKKLYTPFERIEEERNRTIEGTGLGINIVKQLLSLMDTQLEVESVYGEGSRFKFKVKQKVIKWEPIGDFTLAYKKSIDERKKYEVSFRAPDADILVVDDTEMNLTVIRGLLKQIIVEVDTAASGYQALDMVKNKKYDVIFLDHRMPKMDGIETLARMQELPDNLNLDTPCISLTANAVSGAREEYMAAGFKDYLSKPVDGDKLERMLIEYLPRDKVFFPGSKEYISAGKMLKTGNPIEQTGLNGDAGDSTGDEEKDHNIELLNTYKGIDVATALKNCGSADVLVNVIDQFRDSIDDKSNAIEQYEKEGDIENYTILVHALKSSSRLLGAMELSEQARLLEAAGNENRVDEIKNKTPELLTLYRSYKEKLKKEGAETDEDLPLIPDDELKEILGALKEFVEAFDYNSADEAMNALNEYRMPNDFQDKYNKIRKLLLEVDRDELLKIL